MYISYVRVDTFVVPLILKIKKLQLFRFILWCNNECVLFCRENVQYPCRQEEATAE